MRQEVHDLTGADENDEAGDDSHEDCRQTVPGGRAQSIAAATAAVAGIGLRPCVVGGRPSRVGPSVAVGEGTFAAEAFGAAQGEDETGVEEEEKQEGQEDSDGGSDPQVDPSDAVLMTEQSEVEQVTGGGVGARKLDDTECPEGRAVDEEGGADDSRQSCQTASIADHTTSLQRMADTCEI